MFQQTSYSDQLTFFQKVRSFDYILLICIILIGFISAFSMYSTDGGQLLYHSKSHIIRLIVFFTMMIFLSFLNIRFWHATGYLFYVIVFPKKKINLKILFSNYHIASNNNGHHSIK